jgi:hypothetical protein
MERVSYVALGALAGLVASMLLYPRTPLPATSASWTLQDLWAPVLVLLLGLSCFVVLLPTGLISLLNWIDRRSERKGEGG